MTTDQPPAFTVEPADVLNVVRESHPDLVTAAEWKVAALHTLAERDQARARIAELEAQHEEEALDAASEAARRR